MPQDNHPSVGDIQAAFEQKGITPPSGLDRIRAGVIADLHRITCYHPFLGANIDVEVTLDPPYKVRGFILDLEGGFWEITSITRGVTAYSTGTLLVEGTDYDLLPLDASTEERGWNEVRFRAHPGLEPASIVIVGKRGYARQLPDDLFDAELDEMCRRAESKIASSTSNVEEIKQGPVTVKFGKSGGSWSDADKRFKSVARSYMRI